MIQGVTIFLATTLLGSIFGLTGKLIKDARTQREATVNLLRTEMVKAYYKYRDRKKMPYYVKEAWYHDYASYKKLHANTFIDDIKVEIDTWEIE